MLFRSGSQWRKIDREFPTFADDARNLRFGLSTYDFNPFGEQSSSHITWPVTLCIYNLPPWLCMKWKFIMMLVLIQGPNQPGNDIDMYLRPLVEELLELWRGCYHPFLAGTGSDLLGGDGDSVVPTGVTRSETGS